MSSTASSPRLNEKASSKEEASSKKQRAATPVDGQGFRLLGKYDLNALFSRAPVDFDLLSQLTHMSAVATSGMSRAQLFEGTAGLSYSTSKYFRQVHLVAQRLNYDYSRACEVVADTVDKIGRASCRERV